MNDIFRYTKKINIKNLLLIALAGVFLQLFASYILTAVIAYFPDVQAEYSDAINPLVRLTVKMVCYVCIAAPVFEELIFRGIIMQTAQLIRLPFFAANILQSIAFSVYHDNAVQKIYAFILGMFLGFIVHSLGNMLYSIVLHAAINTAGVLEQNFLGQLSDTSMIIIAILAFFCFIFTLYLLYMKKPDENYSNII